VDHVTQKVFALGEREIGSREIGEMVMKELLKLDKVAYIRFASVYKSFQDVGDFADAVDAVRHPPAKSAAAKPKSPLNSRRSPGNYVVSRRQRLDGTGSASGRARPVHDQPQSARRLRAVKAGQLIAEGWHERAGEAHAEVHALRAPATGLAALPPMSRWSRAATMAAPRRVPTR